MRPEVVEESLTELRRALPGLDDLEPQEPVAGYIQRVGGALDEPHVEMARAWNEREGGPRQADAARDHLELQAVAAHGLRPGAEPDPWESLALGYVVAMVFAPGLDGVVDGAYELAVKSRPDLAFVDELDPAHERVPHDLRQRLRRDLLGTFARRSSDGNVTVDPARVADCVLTLIKELSGPFLPTAEVPTVAFWVHRWLFGDSSNWVRPNPAAHATARIWGVLGLGIRGHQRTRLTALTPAAIDQPVTVTQAVEGPAATGGVLESWQVRPGAKIRGRNRNRILGHLEVGGQRVDLRAPFSGEVIRLCVERGTKVEGSDEVVHIRPDWLATRRLSDGTLRAAELDGQDLDTSVTDRKVYPAWWTLAVIVHPCDHPRAANYSHCSVAVGTNDSCHWTLRRHAPGTDPEDCPACRVARSGPRRCRVENHREHTAGAGDDKVAMHLVDNAFGGRVLVDLLRATLPWNEQTGPEDIPSPEQVTSSPWIGNVAIEDLEVLSHLLAPISAGQDVTERRARAAGRNLGDSLTDTPSVSQILETAAHRNLTIENYAQRLLDVLSRLADGRRPDDAVLDTLAELGCMAATKLCEQPVGRAVELCALWRAFWDYRPSLEGEGFAQIIHHASLADTLDVERFCDLSVDQVRDLDIEAECIGLLGVLGLSSDLRRPDAADFDRAAAWVAGLHVRGQHVFEQGEEAYDSPLVNLLLAAPEEGAIDDGRLEDDVSRAAPRQFADGVGGWGVDAQQAERFGQRVINEVVRLHERNLNRQAFAEAP